MKLYIIHCGFYDEEISEGIYEFHVNIPIAANGVDEAKQKVRMDLAFQKKKMHIDGIQEISSVGGHQIELKPSMRSNETIIANHLHRDL